MKIPVYIAGVLPETWFRDTRDERQVWCLNCLDTQTHLGVKMRQTFDYVLTADEMKLLQPAELDGQDIVLAVSDVRISNGRLRVTGKIDLSTVPESARLQTA